MNPYEPVTITLTDSEWMDLIDGSRDGGLEKCCANISALRDCIISAARAGGEVHRFEVDHLRRTLGWVVDGHDVSGIPALGSSGIVRGSGTHSYARSGINAMTTRIAPRRHRTETGRSTVMKRRWRRNAVAAEPAPDDLNSSARIVNLTVSLAVNPTPENQSGRCIDVFLSRPMLAHLAQLAEEVGAVEYVHQAEIVNDDHDN